MPGVTAERTLWIIATIVIAAIVIFGVVYPWVTGMAASVDFSASGFIAYDTGHFEFRLKNLGTVAITKITITITGSGVNTLPGTVTWYVAGEEFNASKTDSSYTIDLSTGTNIKSIPSGEEVQIYAELGDSAFKSGGKLIITITCEFANGKSVTHQYTTYVKSA